MSSRKEFIESHGATCKNWQWSWSFVNEDKRFIIFGAWDKNTNGNRTEILSDAWERGEDGRRRSGYSQSLEHIRLIEEEGYDLYTFPMIWTDKKRGAHESGSSIQDFDPTLSKRSLIRVGSRFFASDGQPLSALPEEIDPLIYPEGGRKKITVNSYERNRGARDACIAHYGFRCAGCDLLFEEFYGELARGIIHVHHLTPVSELPEGYEVDPIKDLIPVCPNCHAVIHATSVLISIDELRSLISGQSGDTA